MAEFNELVRIKKRICAKYKSFDCSGCPIDRSASCLCGIISISSYSDCEFKELEDVLMAWAAEHPAPVYPTWIDVMKMYGVTDETGYCYLDSAYKPIPADIAQKLGIEPKEG